MVDYLSKDDVISLCDGLCDGLKPPSSLWSALARAIQSHVREMADAPSASYIPRYKWLEYISGCVSHAVSIAQETQLRDHEARAMLHQIIGKDTVMRKQFEYDAALEQARYQPIMLLETLPDSHAKRTELLKKRWQAMCAVQQSHMPLSHDTLLILDAAVHEAMLAEEFSDYRIGPMLQFFADMLLQAVSAEDDGNIDQLESLIGRNSRLWRRFALKSSRFSIASDTTPSSPWPAHYTPRHLH